MEKLAYSVGEAAEALGVAPSTIRKAIETGQLPVTRIGIGRGRLLISRQALEALLVKGKVA